MIKTNLSGSRYSDHLNVGSAICLANNIYVVDYSILENKVLKKQGARFLESKTTEIESLNISNSAGLNICCIRYTDNSFTRMLGGRKYPCSQCEGVAFPDTSSDKSWILFPELKYCQEKNNDSNINKARLQLYKTRYYYKSEKIFNKSNTSYLVISLPRQNVPYAHTGFSPSYLQQLKQKHNVVLRAVESIEVVNDEILFM